VPRSVVKTYGRGSFLAFLSPLLSFFMAARGHNGWEQSAAFAMEKDAVAMQGRGYRVVSADEFRLPLFGIAWFRVVYERGGSPADEA
jgi:hypothetical protein